MAKDIMVVATISSLEVAEMMAEKYMSACDGRSTERIIDSALEKERF